MLRRMGDADPAAIETLRMIGGAVFGAVAGGVVEPHGRQRGSGDAFNADPPVLAGAFQRITTIVPSDASR